MGILDFLFGNQNAKIQDYLKKGAIILDVRTDREYQSGAIKKAKHIPLDDLRNHVDELKKLNKPIIVYCASGVRSGKAAKFLNLNNIDAVNGGGINSLSSLLK
ncbi:MAG: rhodanese-like domain-containing protein [Flavobacteriaceae bacterium]